MRDHLSPLAACVVLLAAWLVVVEADERPKDTAMRFPHAGIALSVPAGFERRQVAHRFAVAQAVMEADGKAVISMTLSAHPAGPDEGPEDLSKAAMAELADDLSIRDLKVVKTAPMEVASLAGLAERFSYTYRGRPTVAARVYFVRPLQQQAGRIAYTLTVEAAESGADRLLPVLSELVKSISLIDVRHPCAMGVGPLGDPIVDSKLGYSMRPPRGWYVAACESGLEMGLTDYLAGGTAMPSAQIVVAEIPPGRTAEDCAARCIGAQIEDARRAGDSLTVVSQRRASLGGVAGCQFTIRAATAAPATGPKDAKPAAPLLKVYRVACLEPVGDAGAAAYALIVLSRHVDTATAETMAEKIAAGFSFLPGVKLPETQPTSTTCPTMPAASASQK